MDKFNEPKVYASKASAVRAAKRTMKNDVMGGEPKEGVHFRVRDVGSLIDNACWIWEEVYMGEDVVENGAHTRVVGKSPLLAAPYPRQPVTYKAPCAPAGFLNTMLGTVSRDTVVFASDAVGRPSREGFDIFLATGRALGIVDFRFDPATRQDKPYIISRG